MIVEQFYDTDLAHASYAIESNGEIALVDPARDPQPYYDYAEKVGGKIKAIFETHPHADFVSSHMQIARDTGATIYASKLMQASYPHETFDDGDTVTLGNVRLKALNTPGHSPDSVTVILEDENGKDYAIFTGDFLFIGDVGRPDLREKAGNLQAKREELARQMYKSTREKLMKLDEDVLVYPAHGAGSLCGKNLSDERVSTLGKELKRNYALQPMSEDQFVDILLEGQPFIPKYFIHDVSMNNEGAKDLWESIKSVPRLDKNAELDESLTVVDTRDEKEFKNGHIHGSINIQLEGGKFETWLGTLLGPNEKFYLIAKDEEAIERALYKAAKIGYETNIQGTLLKPDHATETTPELDVEHFKHHPEQYHIIDIRNESEVKEQNFFDDSINLPLPDLREELQKAPTDKPIVVHCAGGYRSTIGTSILEYSLNTKVYDLSVAVEEFKNEGATA